MRSIGLALLITAVAVSLAYLLLIKNDLPLDKSPIVQPIPTHTN